jgi:ribosomal protein L19
VLQGPSKLKTLPARYISVNSYRREARLANYLSKDEKGMIWVGGPVSNTTASLRIGGDELEPDEITSLLSCPPTRAHRKGDVDIGKKTGTKVVKKSGMWSLKADDLVSELEEKIQDLLSRVTADLSIWQSLQSRFSMNIFCGLFMNRSNEGLELSASVLQEMGKRGIELQLDIYGPEFDDDLEGHFAEAKVKQSKPPN